MNQRKLWLLLGLILCLICLFCVEAYAGPGGKIAKAVFTTFWGKLLLAILVIILLPFLLYHRLRQFFKVRHTKKVLNTLGRQDPAFDWMALKNRLTDIFTRTHLAWSQEDMSQVASMCTSWYWQNQQLIHLDRWKSEGLVNKSRLFKLKSMEPIFVRYSGLPKGEDSLIVVSIDANVEDYLVQRDSGLIVEGKKGPQDVETIWTFRLSNGQWLLDNIEQLEFWASYIRMPNEVAPALLQKA